MPPVHTRPGTTDAAVLGQILLEREFDFLVSPSQYGLKQVCAAAPRKSGPVGPRLGLAAWGGTRASGLSQKGKAPHHQRTGHAQAMSGGAILQRARYIIDAGANCGMSCVDAPAARARTLARTERTHAPTHVHTRRAHTRAHTHADADACAHATQTNTHDL
eukprot:3324939-Prymnesium_polylepis.1